MTPSCLMSPGSMAAPMSIRLLRIPPIKFGQQVYVEPYPRALLSPPPRFALPAQPAVCTATGRAGAPPAPTDSDERISS